MLKSSFSRLHAVLLSPLEQVARWLPICAAIGVLAGSASALLIASLNLATALREQHLWLVLFLAPAGLLVGLIYKHVGASVESGTNLILEQIHDPTDVIPARMTPLILAGTFLTHLFGGSAGREGTALQTGAALADRMSGPLRLAPHRRRVLLMAGVSAGFASVFGTPLAGTVFGLEVLALGSVSYDAILPCVLAAFAGDFVTKAWGIHHTLYPVGLVPAIKPSGVAMAMVAGMCFGLTALLFTQGTHRISTFAKRRISYAPLRPFLGGLLVSAGVFALGTTRYIGLGISDIVSAFHQPSAPYDFALKIAFTAVTLGFGFKGGEVTPLFFIGATLGSALSRVFPLPPSLLAGMGFAAVFAGAANTPIASTLMAVELFGAEAGAYAGIACIVSYLFSGHAGIYEAQRVRHRKHGDDAQLEDL